MEKTQHLTFALQLGHPLHCMLAKVNMLPQSDDLPCFIQIVSVYSIIGCISYHRMWI